MKKSNILFLDVIVHILFAGLVVLAYMFFKERLFADSAYYIYNVIDNESFWLMLNRYVLLFSQYLPLIAIKLGFSLKSVLIIYSLGHVLFFYFIYLISRFCYKDVWAGLVLVLIQTIGIMSGFFTPMFELYYSAGFLILFAVILNRESNSKLDLVILILLEWVIITGHPYAYILTGFILLLNFYRHNFKYQKKYTVFIIVILAAFIFKCFTVDDYEQGKIKAFGATLLFKKYDLGYFWSLIGFLIEYYIEILTLCVLSSIYFIVKKKYLELALCGGTFLLLLGMVNVSNYGFEHTRYQEQVYFPLSFIISYTFIRYVLIHLKGYLGIASLILVVAIVSLRFQRIYNDGLNFSHRTAKMEQLIQHCQNLPGNKFIIKKYNIMHEKSIDPNWSYPIETMLIAGINPANKTVTICTDEDIKFNDNIKHILPTSYLHRRWDIYEDHNVNKRYFQLTPSAYTFLNTFCSLEQQSDSSTIEIKTNSDVKEMKCNSYVFYNIVVSNKSGPMICSDSISNISLSYRWIKENKAISSNEPETPLMVDIKKELNQDIIIKTPEAPGMYDLTFIFIKNKEVLFTSGYKTIAIR